MKWSIARGNMMVRHIKNMLLTETEWKHLVKILNYMIHVWKIVGEVLRDSFKNYGIYIYIFFFLPIYDIEIKLNLFLYNNFK